MRIVLDPGQDGLAHRGALPSARPVHPLHVWQTSVVGSRRVLEKLDARRESSAGGRGGGTVILPDGARMVNLPDGARVVLPDALRRGDGAGANLVVAGGT